MLKFQIYFSGHDAVRIVLTNDKVDFSFSNSWRSTYANTRIFKISGSSFLKLILVAMGDWPKQAEIVNYLDKLVKKILNKLIIVILIILSNLY